MSEPQNQHAPNGRRRLVALSVSAEASTDDAKVDADSANLLELSRHLVDELTNASLQPAYGGNWRPSGLTKALAALVRSSPTPTDATVHRLRNYVTPATRAAMTTEQTADAVKSVELYVTDPAPPTVAHPERFALSLMRRHMAIDCSARILVCGRSHGYQGVVPGILEEAFWMQVLRKPVLAFTAFGGATAWLLEPSRIDEQRALWLQEMQAMGLLTTAETTEIKAAQNRGISQTAVTESAAVRLALREFLRQTRLT